MLKQLHIENYAIIEHLDIDFASSLNVITGETGAGKSILLGALGLLSGVRADMGAIADGKDRMVVEGTFGIGGYGLQDLFEELDLDYADEIVIRRVVQSSGKSRAFVGDLPVTLPTLKTISEKLIDIHSQHQTAELSSGDFQRQILDAVAKSTETLQEYKSTYVALLATKREIEKLLRAQREAATKLDYITFQAEQLRELNIQKGEQQELEERQRTLSHSEEITSTYGGGASLLSGDEEPILPQLKGIISSLGRIEDNHSAAAELSERLHSCYIELKDIAEEMSDYALSIELDPRELEAIETRLDSVYSLCKKHGKESGDELVDLLADLEAQLQRIEGGDELILEKEKEAEILEAKAGKIADKLTSLRSKATPKIEKFIKSSLLQLGIKTPNFIIDIEPLKELGVDGRDRIEFLFSANERSAPQPIGTVASGGEMSRLMLSIKHLVAQQMQLPTIIFDEIDTGVSGAVADAMGTIIESMSQSMQVINITHLPQVAAKGDNHFEVYKDKETHIRRLSEQERVERIAAMLSGATITDAARSQAIKLLNH